jgi:hypothetical protein
MYHAVQDMTGSITGKQVGVTSRWLVIAKQQPGLGSWLARPTERWISVGLRGLVRDVRHLSSLRRGARMWERGFDAAHDRLHLIR